MKVCKKCGEDILIKGGICSTCGSKEIRDVGTAEVVKEVPKEDKKKRGN